MKLRLKFISFLMFYLVPFNFLNLRTIHAVTTDAGAAGAFMNFGVGGRPIGMGKAFTGVSDDVDALYWNPGGLGTFRSSQVTFQQTTLVGGGSFQYLGLAQPIYTYGCFAAAVMNLSAGKVIRTDSNFIETGSYDNSETAYMLGYGHRLSDHWGLGFMGKMAENVIDSRKATGLGADIGTMFIPTDDLRIGAMIRNAIQPRYQFETDSETFPRLGRLGVSYELFNHRLLAAADFEKSIGTPMVSDKWYAGLEGKIFENLAIRAGVNTDNITAGAGFGWKSFVIDYSAEYQQLGLFQRFSLKVFFGGFEVDVRADPSVFSPVGLKRHTSIAILCRNRNRIVKWLLTIKNDKGLIVRSFQGYNSPPDSVEWDGTDSHDRVVEPGNYYYAMVATDNNNDHERTRVRKLRIIAPTPLEIEAK